MPHLSNKKLNKKVLKDLDKYIFSIIHDAGAKTRVNIFRELLTKTEKIMIAKRIGMLFLLRKGLSLYEISKALGVSSSTVERFARAQEFQKYRHTTDWVWKHSEDGSFDAFMEALVRLAFTGRAQSFKKFVDEY